MWHPASLVCELWLVTLFTYSGSMKLFAYRHARSLLVPYGYFTGSISILLGYTLPWIELATAAVLAINATPLGGIMAATLGVIFATAGLSVLLDGRRVPCGCVTNSADLVGPSVVARGLLIAGSGCVVAWESRFDYGVPLAMSVGGALFAVVTACLYRIRDVRRSTAATGDPKQDLAMVVALLQ